MQVKAVFEPTGKHRKLAEALARLLGARCTKEKRDFYWSHLAEGVLMIPPPAGKELLQSSFPKKSDLPSLAAMP
jgi:hypothetical protein